VKEVEGVEFRKESISLVDLVDEYVSWNL